MTRLLCSLAILAWAAAVAAQAPSSPLAVSPADAAALAARASEPDDGLDVLHVQGHVYVIAGDGSNIGVQTGPDGVVLVDAGAGRRTEAVLAAIRRLSPESIRFILNTSGHPEHAGGNAVLAAAGVELGGGRGGVAAFGGVRTGAARIAHENLLLAMARPGPNGQTPFPEAAWPTEGFVGKKQMYLNGEGIEARHRPAAYSDGDAIVFFRRSDVIAAGAVVDSDGFPRFDVAAGGSIQGVIDTLNALIDLAIPPTPLPYQAGGTQIIPGRGRIMDQPDLVAYRDMVTIVRDVVQDLVTKGMTAEQVLAARPARGYEGRYGSSEGAWTTEMFVRAVHASLAAGGR